MDASRMVEYLAPIIVRRLTLFPARYSYIKKHAGKSTMFHSLLEGFARIDEAIKKAMQFRKWAGDSQIDVQGVILTLYLRSLAPQR